MREIEEDSSFKNICVKNSIGIQRNQPFKLLKKMRWKFVIIGLQSCDAIHSEGEYYQIFFFQITS